MYRLLFLLLFPTFLGAQGIDFFDGTWEEAKVKAQKEGKDIFVDIYTTWCGPCKQLDKTTFRDEKLGTYFNEHFISYKVEAENGPDRNMAYAFEIGGYPVMLFMDHNGVQKIQARGFKEPFALEAIGKYARDEISVHQGIDTLISKPSTELSKQELEEILDLFRIFHSERKTEWLSLLHIKMSEEERQEMNYEMMAHYPFLSNGLKMYYVENYQAPSFYNERRTEIVQRQYHIGVEMERNYNLAFRQMDSLLFEEAMTRKLQFGLKTGQINEEQMILLRKKYLKEYSKKHGER